MFRNIVKYLNRYFIFEMIAVIIIITFTILLINAMRG